MNRNIFTLILLLLSGLLSNQVLADSEQAFIFSDTLNLIKIQGRGVEVLKDTSNKLDFAQICNSKAFAQSQFDIPNFGVSPATNWVKFKVANNSQAEDLLINIAYPTINELNFYAVSPDGSYTVQRLGTYKKFSERLIQHPNYIVKVHIPKGQSTVCYISAKSGDQVMIPLTMGTVTTVMSSLMNKDWIFGIYFGIILVMALYNLFVFYSVRDKSYIYYVIYIVLVGLLQTSLHGYTFKYFWPDSPWLAAHGIYLLTSLTPIAAVPFFRNFLQTKELAPRYDKALIGFVVVFCICIGLSFANQFNLSFTLQQLCTLVMSFFLLILGIQLMRKRYRPAKFFLLAWSIFLAGVFIFILKDFGAVPYNNFTFYTMPAGSALETILLSFALADKINVFRREKEEMQAQAMSALEENARIIREQNVVLEEKVNERTLELQQSNSELNQAYRDLQEKESQLVESEKMASLGQLTAGIAHEINNPINFVTSNVNPLKRDVGMLIDMFNRLENISVGADSLEVKQQQISELKEEFDFDYLKTEIDYLLKGINEGSTRTAEIVKGLRIFSRLDEDDLKKANINDGLESTTIIVNNLLENKVEIIRDYGNIPMVECYPGKLNQVFLNIITNGIHAVKSKLKQGEKGQIIIKTYNNEDSVFVSIKDTGIGMDEHTKKKLFEPFFTTKEVGEGTGLGLSIAWNTIKKHNGTITVNSELGLGTEFLLEIPIIHKEIKNE